MTAASASVFDLAQRRLPGPLPMWRATVSAGEWRAAALAAAGAGGRLGSLWGEDKGERNGFAVSAAYALDEGLVWLELALPDESPRYPDISAWFPFAGRMQRAAADLVGVWPDGAMDTRPWLNHGAWDA